MVRRGISRFPRKELPYMPVATTTPGRLGTCDIAPIRIAFRKQQGVGTREEGIFAARWLACTLPYRRFADALTSDCARLGADVDR